MPFPVENDLPTIADLERDRPLDRIPVTRWEQLGAQFEQAASEAATPLLGDVLEKRRAEKYGDQTMLSLSELNEKYSGLGIQWDGPQKAGVASLIAEKKAKNDYINKKIESGPDGWLSSGMGFGANVVAHALDPIELGVNIATAGAFRLAGLASFAAKEAAHIGMVSSIRNGAIEGALSQAALEPITAYHNKQFMEDYDSVNFAENVASAATFGGLFEGGFYAYGAFKKARGGLADKIARSSAETQLANGRKVDVSPIHGIIETERNSSMAIPVVDPVKVFDPSNPGGHKVYVSGPRMLFHEIAHDQHGAEGFSSDWRLANSDIATIFGGENAVIHEVELHKNARILSQDQQMTTGDLALLRKAVDGLVEQNNGAHESIKDFVAAVKKALWSKDVEPRTFGELLDYVKTNIQHKGVPGAVGTDNALMRMLEPELEKVGFHGFHVFDKEIGADRFILFKSAIENNGSRYGKLFNHKDGVPFSRTREADMSSMYQAPQEEIAKIKEQSSRPAELLNEKEAKIVNDHIESAPVEKDDLHKLIDDEESAVNQEIDSMLEVLKESDDQEMIDIINEAEKMIGENEKLSNFVTNAAKKCVVSNE